MPNASAGFAVSSSAQVGADVILTGNIKDGEIVNADLSASAAIAATKVQQLSVGVNGGVIPSTGITTAHLAASAGIVDTQLATISTAGKVSGAALTSLASIPAGAGVVPAANLPGPASVSFVSAKTDTGLINTTSNSDTTFTPGWQANLIRVHYQLLGRTSSANRYTVGVATFLGTTFKSAWNFQDNTITQTAVFEEVNLAFPTQIIAGGLVSTYNQVTLTILSVTSTQFTVRVAFNTDSGQNGQAIYWVEAWV